MPFFPEGGSTAAIAHAACCLPDGPVPLPPGAVSVVVPTFNECDNVAELLRRITSSVSPRIPCEVVFVDDSTDGTVEAIRAAARACPYPVTVLHREAPVGGLGGAVVDGLRLARAEWVVVMDGDLQHPPSLVPELIEAGTRRGADLVVASRYLQGGSRSGLAGGYRIAVSRVSTWLAKALFPRRLHGISDPMSGFFGVRRSAFGNAAEAGVLRPLGYKILLELAVRCAPMRVAEVPFAFQERYAGESKSTLREGLRFLRHLAGLRTARPAARLAAYALIGLTGFLPNLVALGLLVAAGVPYLAAEVVANQAAIAWNFLLLEALVFSDRRHRHWIHRSARFALLANADLVLRIPLIALLVRLHQAVLPATALALAVTCALRFAATDVLLYLPIKRRRLASVPHSTPVQALPAASTPPVMNGGA